MNEMQQKFYDFIVEKVGAENVESAKSLLTDAFDKQQNGGFNLMYLTTFVPKLLGLIPDEHKEEVMKVVEEFKSKF